MEKKYQVKDGRGYINDPNEREGNLAVNLESVPRREEEEEASGPTCFHG